MQPQFLKKLWYILLIPAALWLGGRYVLPVALPFLLGTLLALAAEPVVSFGVRRLRLPRAAASVVGVALTLGMVGALVSMAAAAAVRELGNLAGAMPSLEKSALALEDRLVALADKAPEAVRSVAQRTVLEFFDDGTAMLQQVTQRLPGAITGIVSGVGSSLLGIGTGILSAFLISARLPKLRSRLSAILPPSWQETWLPALGKMKNGLLGWLKAQGKMLLIIWGIVTVGLLLLGIPYAPLWAALVAAVDAVPMLGTGLVLGPWAAVNFIQGDSRQGAGLLALYGVAAMTRTVLEPRLVGSQLGLDPLVTLVALYLGFRLWGIPGLLLAPVAAAAVKSILSHTHKDIPPEEDRPQG